MRLPGIPIHRGQHGRAAALFSGLRSAAAVALAALHAQHERAARQALRALCAIPIDEPVTSNAAVAAGAIDVALAVLAAHPQHIGDAHAAPALALELISIAAWVPRGREETARSGACVGECLRALRSCAVTTSFVSLVALTGLSNLTNRCAPNKVAAHEQGAISLLLAVLTAASPSAKVLEAAARILSNITLPAAGL